MVIKHKYIFSGANRKLNKKQLKKKQTNGTTLTVSLQKSSPNKNAKDNDSTQSERIFNPHFAISFLIFIYCHTWLTLSAHLLVFS